MRRASTRSTGIRIRFQESVWQSHTEDKLYRAAEPSGEAALDTDGDGRCLCASLYAGTYGTRPTMQAGGIPAISGGEVQPGELPRLLRRLQLLCADLPSGQNYPDAKP